MSEDIEVDVDTEKTYYKYVETYTDNPKDLGWYEKVNIDYVLSLIACNTECIRNRVYSWYSHSDVTDPEVLAACALMGKDWYPGATYQDMLDAKEWWFPQNPYDEISIWEIEAAQHDAIWQ